jgi:glutamine amidotransferase
MKNICILDYGTGNIQSLKNILDKLKIKYKHSNSEKDIRYASHLILPGVGSFDVAYKKAIKYLPIKLIEDEIFNKNKPILGICVGMQIMASYGEEGKGSVGLNWIEGKVRKIEKKNIPVPHVGWNTVINVKESGIMNNVINRDFYFLNSFYFDVKKKINVIAYTNYGLKFPSVVNKNNIFGVQFHPEKSQSNGKNLLKNFMEIN